MFHDLSGFGDFAPFCSASKTAKISLLTMDYSPWSSKNLIDRNQLKKFMQIGIDVTYMHTNFGWCGLSGFRVMASFCLPSKTAKISLQTMDYSPWSSKNLIDRNPLKKFMQIGIDVSCMRTNFSGRGPFGFENGETTPTKIGVHACDINPYLHKFFEPIPID